MLSTARGMPGPLKLLEIGLGCGMDSVGASARVWRRLLPGAHIVMGEFDEACAEAWAAANDDGRTSVVVGDQSSPAALARWAGSGPFNFIVDDGSHVSSHVLGSFAALWHALRPGGVYFLTDIGVASRLREKGRLKFDDTNAPNGVQIPRHVVNAHGLGPPSPRVEEGE